jgi:hypothetical protein
MRSKVDQKDYNEHRGESWPAWEDFLKGSNIGIAEVDAEINDFVKKFSKQGKYFPIKTETACQSKWTWSTIWLNEAKTSSCHRVHLWDLPEDFDSFHNVPEKLRDRRAMLEGKWPGYGCEYCKDIEQAGGWSDRQHNLEIPGLTPPELETNPTATEVTPRIVEIFAYNTCNLSCTYCNSTLSSQIEQENKRFGEFRQGGVTLRDTFATKRDVTEYYEKFLVWLDKNITELRRLHLLGGETFIQHDLITRVLEIIERNPSPELQFCIFSNLNAPEKYWDLYIKRIQDLQNRGHIQRFDLTASIDCWGPEQEYARYGLNLDVFEERMRWASEQGEWLHLNCNQTVTCLTMRTMPQLIERIAKYSKNKHIGHYFQFYTGTEMYQHPQTYAYSHWADTFDNIYKAMPKDTVHQREAIPRMQGLEAQLKLVKEHNHSDIKKLHIYLDELDKRRETDWRSLFPYLQV